MSAARYVIPAAEDMEALGGRLARASTPGMRIHLAGDLAAGKTTLVRGYLRALGHAGAVKSPTFTLVESYAFDGRAVHHFDLYRMAGAELEFIGFEDYLEPDADVLVEWAERGAGALPTPDLDLTLVVVDAGREVRAEARTARGEALLAQIASS